MKTLKKLAGALVAVALTLTLASCGDAVADKEVKNVLGGWEGKTWIVDGSGKIAQVNPTTVHMTVEAAVGPQGEVTKTGVTSISAVTLAREEFVAIGDWALFNEEEVIRASSEGMSALVRPHLSPPEVVEEEKKKEVVVE